MEEGENEGDGQAMKAVWEVEQDWTEGVGEGKAVRRGKAEGARGGEEAEERMAGGRGVVGMGEAALEGGRLREAVAVERRRSPCRLHGEAALDGRRWRPFLLPRELRASCSLVDAQQPRCRCKLCA